MKINFPVTLTAADSRKRTISGTIVTWGERGNTSAGATVFQEGSIDFSLRPILTAIEQRLSMADFVPNGVEVRFDIDDFLRGSALERAQVYEILNRIGAMSIEQIQEEEDLIR